MSWGYGAATRYFFCPVSRIGVLLLVVLGCQGKGDVSGKVTYQDKAIVFGTVLFEGSDGNTRQGNIEKDGSYCVRGVATGEAHVAVNSPNPKAISLVSKNPDRKPEPYPDAPGWFQIPKQYEAPSTSGLTYKIKGGSNEINIELK
jgi:hypothetical protein